MKRILGAVVLIGVLAALLAAQNTEQPQNPAGSSSQVATESKPIKVRVDLVNVLFTVTDKKNRLVLDLVKDAVRVSEDNKPQSIRYFSRESDLPLRIAILIDTSNSIRDRLRFEQEAAVDFLTTTVRPGKDLAFIVAFDVEPQLLQDYTDSTEKLSRAVRTLQAGGNYKFFCL